MDPQSNGDDSCSNCQQELFKAHSLGPRRIVLGAGFQASVSRARKARTSPTRTR